MNYRNTKPIHTRISQYEDQKTLAYFDDDTLGRPTVPVTIISKDDVYKTLCRLLIDNAPGDIAVLTFEKDAVLEFTRFIDSRGRNVSFTTNVSEWEGGNKILKATVQSFKGLEANIVLLFASDFEHANNQLKYVGESRAKYELYIVDAAGKSEG